MNAVAFFRNRLAERVGALAGSTLLTVAALVAASGFLLTTSAVAASGDVITNGTIPNAVNKQPGPIPTNLVGFLFEPEVPFSSLKTVPIWNELEQLLDNPYLV